MRTRQIVSLAIVIVVLGVLFWVVKRPAEPTYQGRRLSVWLEAYADRTGEGGPSFEAVQDANQAVRHIGTNAVPVLVNLLHRRDANLRILLTKVVPLQSAEAQYWKAVEAFAALGPMGKTAIPDLIELIRDPSPRGRACAESAMYSLAAIGAESVPALVKTLTDKAAVARARAAKALGMIGTRSESAETAIPMLIQCLQDSDRDVRERAVQSLGLIGHQPALEVPALIERLKDQDIRIRESALNALGKIGKPASLIIPGLIEALKDRHPPTRLQAVKLLASYKNDAKEAAPALLSTFNAPDSQYETKCAAASFLTQIAPDMAKQTAPDLVNMLKESYAPNWHGHDIIAEPFDQMLGRISETSVPLLMDLMDDRNPKCQCGAVWILGRIGTNATVALPKLESLARNRLTNSDQDFELNITLATALNAIEPRDCTNFVVPLFLSSFRIPFSAARNSINAFVSELHEGRQMVVPTLISLLDSPNADVRINAITALGYMGADARGALPKLSALARQLDINTNVLIDTTGLCDAVDRAVRNIEHPPVIRPESGRRSRRAVAAPVADD